MIDELISIKTLTPKTKKLLVAFSKTRFIKNFYLAGGTALVLYFGHRISNDLDFFSTNLFHAASLKRHIKKIGIWEASSEIENSLIGYVNGTKTSFFYLPYPLLEKPQILHHVRIAPISDIALMKLLAVSQRATKRDFVDLYLIAKECMPLPELLKLFPRKFGRFDYNLHHIIKSLVYFDEVERDRMPRMRIDLDWKTVKTFFLREQKNLQRLLTKL